MRRRYGLVSAALALVLGCAGGEGGGGDDAPGDVAPGPAWEALEAPVLGGFMKLESYGCRDDAIFVAVSGGQRNSVFKLDLADAAAGWQQLNDQSAQLEPVAGHVVLAFPEGKT